MVSVRIAGEEYQRLVALDLAVQRLLKEGHQGLSGIDGTCFVCGEYIIDDDSTHADDCPWVAVEKVAKP